MLKRWEVHIIENELDLIVGKFNTYENAEKFADTLQSDYTIVENKKWR